MATIRINRGKWQAIVRRTGFPQQSKSFDSKTNVRIWARQKEAELDAGVMQTNIRILDKTTVSDILLRYRETVTINKKGNASEGKRIDSFLKQPWANYKLSRVTSGVFSHYRDQRSKQVKPATVRRDLGLLRAITKTRARFRKAGLEIGKGQINTTKGTESGFTTISEDDIELPDIITDLQDKTQLTRKSIVKILIDSDRIEDSKRNPQQFIDQSAEAINRTKRLALIDGIKYHRIGDEHFYAQELFETEELTSYMKNAIETQKSVLQYVVYDSESTERRFAEDLESNEAVKVHAKLPVWFKIPTPLGSYNPDWAVLIDQDGVEKLFFVVETKSSGWWDDLRHQEWAKIECGKKHFDEIAVSDNPA